MSQQNALLMWMRKLEKIEICHLLDKILKSLL